MTSIANGADAIRPVHVIVVPITVGAMTVMIPVVPLPVFVKRRVIAPDVASMVNSSTGDPGW